MYLGYYNKCYLRSASLSSIYSRGCSFMLNVVYSVDELYLLVVNCRWKCIW